MVGIWDDEMSLLEIEQISFRVPARMLLERLDLAVAAGEILALVGTNGTGKSTLAYLIMGCEGYRAESGDILFDGRSIDTLPLHERARLGITLAWQEPVRFEGLTVSDYLTVWEARSGCGRLPARVGLSAGGLRLRMVDKTLSGGERKRIELASVLALDPRLAILDEPDCGHRSAVDTRKSWT